MAGRHDLPVRGDAEETIALAQRDDGNWAIRFRNFDLGTLTEEGNEIRRSGLVRSSGPDHKK